MTKSTVDRNLSRADGAGIYSSGAVVLARSTVSNNDAFGTFALGGGINATSAVLTANAITGNSAGSGGGISSTPTVTANHSVHGAIKSVPAGTPSSHPTTLQEPNHKP
jgi:hypothetical protein